MITHPINSNVCLSWYVLGGLTLTWRFNYLHWASHMSFKVAPLEHVPLPFQARLRHSHDFLVSYYVIPDVDTCHFANETLSGIKRSSYWILFLSQNQDPITTDHVTYDNMKRKRRINIYLSYLSSSYRFSLEETWKCKKANYSKQHHNSS